MIKKEAMLANNSTTKNLKNILLLFKVNFLLKSKKNLFLYYIVKY